ncbi:glycosyltransferase (plasmid) [Halobaculum sp. CBA1158]|uniref:glycosyltransferase n=1 Tax=Halobaculum sp. CBA1158 TaxID=2904243 RepID=UPI001F4260A7|nr:glycosyltransferase [Halobaculum sp. CBA1158]UIP01736.1 glycosyltransferase [Halobaculum sp. CBA1158]
MDASQIAVAHKDYDVRGGGEILAEELARTFGCPLFVGHGDPDNEPGGQLDVREISSDSLLHRVMERDGVVRSIAHLIHWRDNAHDELQAFDTVVTSGNEPLWWQPSDRQTVVAYTHSPPRWMYDRFEQIDSFAARTYNQIQRRAYEGAVKRPDLWVANSDLVARRINRYWNIPEHQIRTVYPPVQTDELSPSAAPTQDYYVALSRLDSMKHMDEIVRAFNRRDDHLIVAGDGPERERLEELAAENVTIAGYVSEERKADLLAGARAFVYAAENEDFGMAPVEAMAAGTPVIGVDEGFTTFQVQDGENGILFERGELPAAMQRFEREGVRWSAEQLAEFADANFSVDRFRREIRTAVREAQRRSRVDPDWTLPDPEPEPEPEATQPLVSDGGDG